MGESGQQGILILGIPLLELKQQVMSRRRCEERRCGARSWDDYSLADGCIYACGLRMIINLMMSSSSLVSAPN
jgi:hypothetical protein